MGGCKEWEIYTSKKMVKSKTKTSEGRLSRRRRRLE